MIALLKSDFAEIVAVTQRYSSRRIFEEVLLEKLHLLFDLVQLSVLQKRLIIGSTQDGQFEVGFCNAGCWSRLIPNKSQLAEHFTFWKFADKLVLEDSLRKEEIQVAKAAWRDSLGQVQTYLCLLLENVFISFFLIFDFFNDMDSLVN